MNTTRFCLAALAAVACLLCSCASTSVKKTWKAPDGRPPEGKIAVITIDARGILRKGFENRLATRLQQEGAPAMVTYDQLALEDIKKDKKAAVDLFQAQGAGAVLIVRLMDVDKSYRVSRPGGERYAPAVTGYGYDYGYMGWYDYYSVGFMDMSPTYGTSKVKVFLEASLHDLKTEKRIWVGLTQTVVGETMDRVAEMDPIVEKILGSMRKDGVLK